VFSSPKPDLVVTNVRPSKKFHEGENQGFYYTIKNVGNKYFGAYIPIRVEISGHTNITYYDHEGVYLHPGASWEFYVSSNNLHYGDHDVKIIVNTNRVEESNYGNNSKTLHFMVFEKLRPNLSFAPVDLHIGNRDRKHPIHLGVKICNTGNKRSEWNVMRYYFYKVYPAGWYFGADVWIRPLNPGECLYHHEDRGVRVPNGYGTYKARVFLDYHNYIAESNEGDNMKEKWFHVNR